MGYSTIVTVPIMRSTLVLSIALAAVAGLVSGDPTCVSTDSTVDGTLFTPLRKKLEDSKSDYITFADYSIGFLGFDVEYKGATAGNFSSLRLTPSSSPSTPSSQICTEVTKTTTVKTFNINLGFDDLEAAFGSFAVQTPFFNIGGTNTKISLSGENLRVSVTTATDSTSKTCKADLKDFTFTDWGTLQISLGDGIVNWILEKVFNNYANGFVLNLLNEFGVGSTINSFATKYAAQIISTSGQEQTVCDLISLLK